MSKKFFFLSMIALIAVSVFTGCSKKYDTKISCAMVLRGDEKKLNDANSVEYLVFNEIEKILSNREDLCIVDLGKESDVQKQHAFEQSDWSSQEKVAVIGKAINAELVCIVSVLENTYKVEFVHVSTLQKKTHIGDYSKKLFSERVTVKGLGKLKNFSLKDMHVNSETKKEK